MKAPSLRGRLFGAAIAGAMLAAPASGLAAESPTPGPVDPRIRTIFYDPLQVVTLDGFFGYQMMIEFGPGEKIENVSIGDGLAWQVTPNRRASLLFLKPVAKTAGTNMTVVTNQRRYAFELRARKPAGPRAPDMAYVVRFTYPYVAPPPLPPPPAPPKPPQRKNLAYTYTGSRLSLPSLVFDDGRFTYFQWPTAVSTPALFLLLPDGSESIVNYGVRDGFVVVEQLAPRFVLRNGKEVTTVINDAWRDPVPEATAPRPHDAKTAKDAARAGAHR